MFVKLLRLEIKSFFRNPQFGANLAMKILMFFMMAYFSVIFVVLGLGFHYLVNEEFHQDSLKFFSRYFIYYWILDLLIRYFLQQMPTQNLKPLLVQNITKHKLIQYSIIKTFTHFFNWGYLLFLIPFAISLILNDYSVLGVLMFSIGILFTFYFSNFLNILLNGKTAVVVSVCVVFAALGGLEYLNIIRISEISEKIFYSFYAVPGAFLIPVVLTSILAYFVYKTFTERFYLDKGLETEKAEGKTENIEFLNKFGVTGTFINNDIRLLKRSKAAKSAAIGGIMFLFYGLLSQMDVYSSDFMQFFTGIFVTGGFMFMFGQRVPSWDSSYYPLMMTQNVPYKQYLKAKWTLVVLATAVSMVLALFYVFISWELYFVIFAGGLYNIGANAYFTLLAGAYNKQSIDLNTAAKSFGGGKNAFNLRTFLMMIPQMLVPMAVFAVVKYFFGMFPAVAAIGLLGLIGFLLRDKIFDIIVKVYKSEKYSTLKAFKES